MFWFTTYSSCPQLIPCVRYCSAFERCEEKKGPVVAEVLPMNRFALHFISDAKAHFIRENGPQLTPLFPVSIIGYLTQKAYNQFRGSSNGVLVISTLCDLYRLFGVNMCGLTDAAKYAGNILARVKFIKRRIRVLKGDIVNRLKLYL
jgi:hypothetical protein